ncbi:24352_t:CDS:2 [Racocetra persica]|uniref:24352_t:CDS:1 n=1 Tax=Racocetra persica TaxID=160502 RepID=A0ACA9RHI6_9GLOM|nr:24352_t:CDS:2 [Racocetra persica]
MSTKRKSYMVKQKLEIISKAKEMSNKAVVQIFGVDHSQVSRWQKQEKKEVLNKWVVQLRQDSLAKLLKLQILGAKDL